jgi:hypothetical protein
MKLMMREEAAHTGNKGISYETHDEWIIVAGVMTLQLY